MQILDGKKISERILEDLKREIKSRRLKLKLAVVLVGRDSVSKIFIREKEKACRKIGIGFSLYQFKKNIGGKELEKGICDIVRDPLNSGVVIQLPLPKSMDAEDTQKILNFVCKKKDADILSEDSYKKFKSGQLLVLPPTVGAVSVMLKNYRISLKGKNIVIVGAGRLVGRPLSDWLKLQKVNFKILDKTTKDISVFTKRADILISGVGKARLVRGTMVKEGAVIIDAGSSMEGGRGLGDIDFKSVSKKAGYITKVPGGVGPLTVACLLSNLVKLNQKK